MRVLIGVDGSSGSGVAVEFAGRLLDGARDEITLYYSPPHVTIQSSNPLEPELLASLQDYLVETVFNEARRRLPPGLQETTSTLVGSQEVAHGLLVAADQCRAELIVVGAHGSATNHRVAVGSITRTVVHHATIPVLIVRPRFEGAMPDRLRVLLACNGTPSSIQAAGFAKRLSWPAQVEGRVIAVVESMLAGKIPDWLEDQLREQEQTSGRPGYLTHCEEGRRLARQSLVGLCGNLPAIFTMEDPLVEEGNAPDTILKHIEADEVDLVVVGSRGLGAMARFVHGSTSERLLTHARCSVLIVRQHEAP